MRTLQKEWLGKDLVVLDLLPCFHVWFPQHGLQGFKVWAGRDYNSGELLVAERSV